MTHRVVFTARAKADAVKQFYSWLTDRRPPPHAGLRGWRKQSPSSARCLSGIPSPMLVSDARANQHNTSPDHILVVDDHLGHGFSEFPDTRSCDSSIHQA